MARSESDRNVLFGLLAWQLGIVDRETVMAAMFDCTTDKSRSLPEVLESRGVLAPDDRVRLEQLVARKLQRHSGDTGLTLAELNSTEILRNKLQAIASGTQHPTVGADADHGVVDPKGKTYDSHHTVDAAGTMRIGDKPHRSETEPQPAPPRPQGPQRFRVLRNHARGGLGEVLLAVDDELNREVAVKQILAKHADNRTSRSRFLLEAEITGKLEHPGVVPVYGLGTQADGRPYYAMRFIRGESLEDAIMRFHDRGFRGNRDPGRHALELRQLLTRFLAVCNTIEYAHSRGIVHRDIKPENIMLGPYGETLVVDWGLARPFTPQGIDVDAETEFDLAGDAAESVSPQITAQSAQRPTQMGAVVGTPQFMSPEQASGRIDLMSRASDVYSLGATLYCLLTSEPPFTSNDVRKVLIDVQKGRFPPPRSVAADIPRGLEAVCLKAMALNPADRYASAGALADDIEHWLADEPLAALHETGFERLQRWMRRHKSWTRAAAVALLIVAGVAGTAYAREAQLRSQAERAKLEAEQAKAEAERAKSVADEARATADAERSRAEAHARRAEEQSALALSTLKSVLNDIQARLKNVPAAQSARLSMLSTVIEGLKKVARNLETASEADRSLVRAHLDVGDIFLQAGTSDAAGATALAEEQFENALKLTLELAAKGDGDALRADLGDAYQRLGDVEMQRGDARAAIDWLTKSLAPRQALVDADPRNTQARRDRAATVQRLGIAAKRLGDVATAERRFVEFLEICEGLVRDEPDNSENHRSLSVAYERMGDLRREQGNTDEAAKFFERCKEVRLGLVKTAKDAAGPSRDLSVTYDRLADIARDRQDLDAADGYLHLSLGLRMKLYDGDPNNVQSLRDLVVSYSALGELSYDRGNLPQAATYFDNYHRFALRLAESDPGNAEFQRDLARAYYYVAVTALRGKDSAVAIDNFSKRLAVLEKLSATVAGDKSLWRETAETNRALAVLLQAAGEFASARDRYSARLELVRQLSADDLADAALRQTTAEALFDAAEAAMRVGESDRPATQLSEAAEIAAKLLEATPEDVERLNFAVQIAMLRGRRAWEARRIDEAATHFRAAGDYVRRISKLVPADSQAACQSLLKELDGEIERCDIVRKAVGDSEYLLQQSPSLVPELLDARAATLLGAKQTEEAGVELEKLVALDAKNGDHLFLAACRFAQLADIGNRPPAADRAMALLQQAFDVGHFHAPDAAARLECSDALKPLQHRDDYKRLVERVRAEKKAAKTSEGRTT